MKKKGFIFVVLAFLLSSTVVYAASVNGAFAGLPIVNVKVNDQVLKSSVPGVVLQGSTLLPARSIAESLNSIVSWDQATMTATIKKYDVTMCFVDDIIENDDSTWDLKNPYGYIDAGQGQTVMVYYETGPLEKQQYEIRIIVKDLNGDILKSSVTESIGGTSLGMVGYISVDDIAFKNPGNYKFEFQIKFNNEFKTVEDKILIVQ